MKLKSVTSTLLILSLLGCGGASMDGSNDGQVVSSNSVDSSTLPSDPIIVDCESKIAEEIKWKGDDYTIDTYDSGAYHSYSYWWRGDENNTYETTFTWGYPAQGCEISRLDRFKNSNILPVTACVEDAKAILNTNGLAGDLVRFTHSGGASYHYWWWGLGIAYNFEFDDSSSYCEVSINTFDPII